MKPHSRRILIPLFLLFFSTVTAGRAAEQSPPGSVEGRLLTPAGPAGGGVVYAVPLGGAPKPPTPVVKTIVQKEMQFVPPFTVVTAGSTLRFENRDNRIHNIKSTSPGNRFFTGAHFPGKTQQIVLKHPGEVRLRCNIHFEMQGLVYVTPSDYFAVTDRGGHYRLTGLPEGDYQIEAWHPDLTAEKAAGGGKTVHVGREPVHLDLGAAAPAGRAH